MRLWLLKRQDGLAELVVLFREHRGQERLKQENHRQALGSCSVARERKRREWTQ